MDHFGLIAPYYDRIFKSSERGRLFDIVGLPISGTLLDAGGGTGRISQLLKNKVSQVVVADLSFDMLIQAHAKGGLQTACTHTERLPFLSNYFDRVIMIDALHHVCDQAETAQELWRVLKFGGRLVIEEPDVRTLGVKILALAEKLMGMRSHFLAPARIASLFDGNAECQITSKGSISWVIIDKPAN
jgi:ubiquinone/menaquinone biosynthesis C-methylase UbiE